MPADCFGHSTGSATVNPAGGTPGYTFLWDDIGTQQTQTATLLTAVTYNCIITDANNCPYPNNPVSVIVS